MNRIEFLKKEVKDVSSRLRNCQSDISKLYKERLKIEERLKAIVEAEEDINQKLKILKEVEKNLEKNLFDNNIELTTIEITNEKDIEIKKIRKELENKTKLIETTRDNHDLMENPNSGVYLLLLDKCYNLKDKFVIPSDKMTNNYSVYKYGKSKDCLQRNDEHNQCLGKIIGKDLKMIHKKSVSIYRYTDAENKIKKYFKENQYVFITDSQGKKYKELVVLPDDKIKDIKKFYDLI